MTDDDLFDLTRDEEDIYVECGRMMLANLHEQAMRLPSGGFPDGLDAFPV